MVSKSALENPGTTAVDFEYVQLKCTNLTYLKARTKSNLGLMQEMISLYLEQTPPLLLAMKQGLADEDWDSLAAAAHKMIPSFSIVGINQEFETMAKKIQEYARNQQETDKIQNLILQIENVCTQACTELESELNKYNLLLDER